MITGDGGVDVLLNRGGGTFTTPFHYGATSRISWATAADFDGDGKLDVATADSSPAVSLLINHGPDCH